MRIRKAETSDDIARAVSIDEALMGSGKRAAYIKSIAETSGLTIAGLQDDIQAFACLDHHYFFAKPFLSLLIVAPDARRRGLGAGLLTHHARALPEVWTSTNRSNMAMRQLLDNQGWHFCGEVDSLDEGDPERFYKAP